MGLVIEFRPKPAVSNAAFSDAMEKFRSGIEGAGGRIVEAAVFADAAWIDWLPADADPDMEPIRAEFLLPAPAELPADQAEAIELEADLEEIRVIPDAEALFHGSRLTTCLVPGWAIPTPRDLLRGCSMIQAGNCTACPKLEEAVANKDAGGSLVALVGRDRQAEILLSA